MAWTQRVCLRGEMDCGHGRGGGDIGASEEGELRHADAVIGKERAATGIANNEKAVEIAAHVLEAPRLILLDEPERFVEAVQHRACLDVRSSVVDGDGEAPYLRTLRRWFADCLLVTRGAKA